MQKKYNVPSLTSKTPEASQTKLRDALMAVSGVQKAILHPDTSSFEIQEKRDQKVKKEDITSAATDAGFKMN